MITFNSHPAAEEPVAKTLALAALILLMAVLATRLMGEAYWGVFSTLVLVAAMNRYLLKSEYRLDEEGLEVRGIVFSRRRPWSEFRRLGIDKKGVFLSPFKRPSALDAFRGEYIHCPKHREEVIKYVRRRIG